MERKSKRPRGSGPSAQSSQLDRIYGVHAVRAALKNKKRDILSVYATRNGHDRIADLIGARGLEATELTPEQLSKRLGGDSVHQGVMVEARPLPEVDLEDIAGEASNSRLILVLDQVTDPHNAGAILRSAAAFNASGVIMTRRHSPPLDGTMAKAACGAIEHVPVVLVPNLARALEALAERGVVVIGLDGNADEILESLEISFPCALVLGAEGKGLRRLTAEKCDTLCRITTPGPLRSLNVSNAAAVAMHTIMTR